MTILPVNHLGDISSPAGWHAGFVKLASINTFGSRLRAARERAELTQKQLEAETGVQQSRISELEQDTKVNINVWQMHAICRRLGVTIEYVLDGASQAGAEEAEAVALLRQAEPSLREAAMNALRGMLSRKDRAVLGRH